MYGFHPGLVRLACIFTEVTDHMRGGCRTTTIAEDVDGPAFLTGMA